MPARGCEEKFERCANFLAVICPASFSRHHQSELPKRQSLMLRWLRAFSFLKIDKQSSDSSIELGIGHMFKG
jgi:hypothetical protein